MEKSRESFKIFRIHFVTIFLALMLVTSAWAKKELGISGKVVTEDGKPFPGVMVKLSMLKEGYVGYSPIDYPMINTDKRGGYNFRNLKPGPFEVKYTDGSIGTWNVEEPVNLKSGTYKVEAEPPQYGIRITDYTAPNVRKILTGEIMHQDRGSETYYLSASLEGIEYKGKPITVPDISLKQGGDIVLIMEKEEVEKLKDEEVMGGSKVKGWYSLTDTNGKEVIKFRLFGNFLITTLVLPGKYILKVFDSKLFKDQVFKDVFVSPGKTTFVKVPTQ